MSLSPPIGKPMGRPGDSIQSWYVVIGYILRIFFMYFNKFYFKKFKNSRRPIWHPFKGKIRKITKEKFRENLLHINITCLPAFRFNKTKNKNYFLKIVTKKPSLAP